jgi:hypothetical protein
MTINVGEGRRELCVCGQMSANVTASTSEVDQHDSVPHLTVGCANVRYRGSDTELTVTITSPTDNLAVISNCARVILAGIHNLCCPASCIQCIVKVISTQHTPFLSPEISHLHDIGTS